MTFKELFKKVDDMNKMLAHASYDDVYNVRVLYGGYSRWVTFKSYEDFKSYMKYEYMPVISKKIVKQDIIIGECYCKWYDEEDNQHTFEFTVDLIKI